MYLLFLFDKGFAYMCVCRTNIFLVSEGRKDLLEWEL